MNGGSEFRTILTRINEVKSVLQQSKHVKLAKQLGEVNDSLRVIEGNHADFSDAVFKTMHDIQTAMDNGFKAMEAKLVALEAKLEGRDESAAGPTTPSPPSSGRKRKIIRHPDLSVSKFKVKMKAQYASIGTLRYVYFL